MKISAHSIAVILVLSLLLVSAGSSSAFTPMGEKVGLVAGTVATGDSERGLTARANASGTSQAKGYLPVGTKVQGNAQFKNGYMKLVSPVDGVWVKMAHLTPLGGEAVVNSVDQPEQCLRVRQGPGTGYDMAGCAELASKLQLTGVWTSDNWAQIDAPVKGWVYATQIKSDLKPVEPQPVVSTPAPRRVESTSVRDDSTVWQESPRRRWRHRWNDDYYPGAYSGFGLHFEKKWGGKKK